MYGSQDIAQNFVLLVFQNGGQKEGLSNSPSLKINKNNFALSKNESFVSGKYFHEIKN